MRLMRLFLSEQQAQSSLALISPGRPPKGISDATEASQRRLCCQNGPGTTLKGPRSYIAFGFCMTGSDGIDAYLARRQLERQSLCQRLDGAFRGRVK